MRNSGETPILLMISFQNYWNGQKQTLVPQNIHPNYNIIIQVVLLFSSGHHTKAGDYINIKSMQFNPLQSQQTNTLKQSKSKVNPVPIPLTFLQVEKMLDQKQLQPNLSKLCLLGRVLRLKEMTGRTIATLTDQTGIVNIIESQFADILEENEYFRFIVNVRMDKEQPILMSLQVEKVTDHNMLQFHNLNIMFHHCRPD